MTNSVDNSALSTATSEETVTTLEQSNSSDVHLARSTSTTTESPNSSGAENDHSQPAMEELLTTLISNVRHDIAILRHIQRPFDNTTAFQNRHILRIHATRQSDKFKGFFGFGGMVWMYTREGREHWVKNRGTGRLRYGLRAEEQRKEEVERGKSDAEEEIERTWGGRDIRVYRPVKERRAGLRQPTWLDNLGWL